MIFSETSRGCDTSGFGAHGSLQVLDPRELPKGKTEVIKTGLPYGSL